MAGERTAKTQANKIVFFTEHTPILQRHHICMASLMMQARAVSEQFKRKMPEPLGSPPPYGT